MGNFMSSYADQLGVRQFDEKELSEDFPKNFDFILSADIEQRKAIIKQIVGTSTYDSIILIGSKWLRDLGLQADEMKYFSKIPEGFRDQMNELWHDKEKKYLLLADDCIASDSIPSAFLDYLISGGNLKSRVILTSVEPLDFGGEWYIRNVNRVIVGKLTWPAELTKERLEKIHRYLGRKVKILWTLEKFKDIWEKIQYYNYKLVIEPKAEKALSIF